jgi:nicotinamide-nucleotide amidase
MKAEILAVGSELLTPDSIDTNSLYLTQQLNEAGIEVHLKTIVGDNLTDLMQVLNDALKRSNIIVLSGGLGPTEDDLTRSAVAGALGRSISTDPDILDTLRRRFASRGQHMAKINDRQAEAIEGAEVLPNPLGTAPGMWLKEDSVNIILLPGPPRELKQMFETSVLPRLREFGQGRKLVRKCLNVSGMTESEVDSRVSPIYKSYPGIQTTILATTGHISLRFYQWMAAGENSRELDELASRIEIELGDAIFSSSGESLEEAIGHQLRRSRLTLSVAESCTAGILGMCITRVPGSSDYFVGGVLCYSNDVKTSLCGVPDELIGQHGAVSAETAAAMAQGVRLVLHSDIGLSITGIAGPSGGSPGKPVGLVYVGVSDGNVTQTQHRVLPGDRHMIRERAANFALSFLRKFLL